MHLLIRATFLRYVLASAVALGVDMSGFLLGLAVHLPAFAASAFGYCLGIVAHWWMSSRAVFAAELADPGADRRWQQLLFLMSAFVGLAVTVAIVGMGSLLGLDPRLAKLVAIAVAFKTTYLLRRQVVFICSAS